MGLKLSDVHVTESGFAAEMGYEKFWNLKCRYSGLTPDAAVIVATVRALKSHGGAPQPRPGRPLPEAYTREDVGLVEAGCVNLLHHIGIVRRSGVPSVVCINKFHTDSPAGNRRHPPHLRSGGSPGGRVRTLGKGRRGRAGTGRRGHGRLQFRQAAFHAAL